MNCNGISFFPSNFMFHSSQDDEQRAQSSLNPDFHGVESFLGKRSMLGHEEMNGEDDTSDEGSLAGEKKRRLSIEQVKTLEKNFELGNKLEPERKMQLARVLGLQPRQIAIWFQNRRARWKTKQLEKDYDLLMRQFEAVKADNEQLRTQNQHLHAEIVALKSRDSTESINLNKETDQGSCSNKSENSSDIKLDISRAPAKDSPTARKGHFPMFFGASIASRQDHTLLQKMDQIGKEDNLGNMFYSIDENSGLWPWIEHQHFT